MYNLIDPKDNTQLDQAYELVDLFKKLDFYTHQNKPVVITDGNDEVVAGNVLGFEHAGKTLRHNENLRQYV